MKKDEWKADASIESLLDDNQKPPVVWPIDFGSRRLGKTPGQKDNENTVRVEIREVKTRSSAENGPE